MKKKVVIISLSIFLVILIGSIISYFCFFKETLTPIKNLEFEINSKIEIAKIIKNSKNIKIINKDSKIKTSKLGKNQAKIIYQNRFKQKKSKNISYKIIDTKAPTIESEEVLTTIQNHEIDLLENVVVTDNSKEEIKAQVKGDYDFQKVGKYKLTYEAIDKSGNKATKEFTLKVEEEKENTTKQSQSKATNQQATNNLQTNKLPYYIKINRALNMVMVYGLDDSGNYTKLIKIFTCSTGGATPLGTFKTTQKYVWRPLFGDVYGQYATRIVGSILFHSVPYTSQSKDSLEWEEYNKLGTAASMGCIRLRVVDVKWIYDNCPLGTIVEIYDSNSLDGITKPVYDKIDGNSPNKGWDPTDPDPSNPW